MKVGEKVYFIFWVSPQSKVMLRGRVVEIELFEDLSPELTVEVVSDDGDRSSLYYVERSAVLTPEQVSHQKNLGRESPGNEPV